MENNWLNLQKKVIAISGSGSGMGAEIAKQAALQGAHVAMLDRNKERIQRYASELSSLGLTVAGIYCDVTDENSCKKAAEEVNQRLGLCSGLVNCAGVMKASSAKDVSKIDWDTLINTNLTGCLNTSRSFYEYMSEYGSGSIVHIASVASWFPQPTSGAYSASKAALRILSEQLAIEWADSGIRSNTISPGMIKTKLTKPFYEDRDIESGRSKMTASRRIGTPSDISSAALFLLSGQSSYINATDLIIDGGLSSMIMALVPRPGY